MGLCERENGHARKNTARMGYAWVKTLMGTGEPQPNREAVKVPLLIRDWGLGKRAMSKIKLGMRNEDAEKAPREAVLLRECGCAGAPKKAQVADMARRL